MFLGSKSRRSCGYSLVREHISACIDDIGDGPGDGLVLRWPALCCPREGVQSGWAECSWGKSRVVVVGIPRVGSTSRQEQMTLKIGLEMFWCYAVQHLAAPERVCRVGGRSALGVQVAS